MARTTLTVDVAGDGWTVIQGHEVQVEGRSIAQALRNLADVLDRRAPHHDEPRPRPGKPPGGPRA